jgi:hypothetical protein
METNIFEPNKDFQFSNISLAQPSSIQGGAYFTKILYDSKPFYIETPKCSTKQGFVKNGKKIFCDLMFDNSNEDFINWIENLETKCQKLIYEKGDSWFQNKLELDDIETAFTSALRIYKSGKYYLMRTSVKMNYNTNIPLVKIYNESAVPLTTDDLNSNTNIISIFEVQGIKFTSRNFQIELEMKQAMVLNTYEMFENCLIKKSNNKNESFQSQNIYNENSLQDKILIQSKKDTTEQAKPPIDLEESINNDSNSSKSLEKMEEVNIAKEVALEIASNLEKKDLLNNQESFGNYLENKDENSEQEKGVTENNDLNLEVEELEVEENNSELKEFDISENIDTLESITLKKPNEHYYQIYKEARKKAKQAKKDAVIAFLEAKNIKKVYMLDDLDESDSEDSDLNNLETYSDESEIDEEDELIEG